MKTNPNMLSLHGSHYFWVMGDGNRVMGDGNIKTKHLQTTLNVLDYDVCEWEWENGGQIC